LRARNRAPATMREHEGWARQNGGHMAASRSAPSLDPSRVARIPLAAAQASIAAGERMAAWLAAAEILNAGASRRWVESVTQQPPANADAVRAGEAPLDALGRLAAHQRDMAFAVSLMSFDVGMTWFQRFSEVLRT